MMDVMYAGITGRVGKFSALSVGNRKLLSRTVPGMMAVLDNTRFIAVSRKAEPSVIAHALRWDSIRGPYRPEGFAWSMHDGLPSPVEILSNNIVRVGDEKFKVQRWNLGVDEMEATTGGLRSDGVVPVWPGERDHFRFLVDFTGVFSTLNKAKPFFRDHNPMNGADVVLVGRPVKNPEADITVIPGVNDRDLEIGLLNDLREKGLVAYREKRLYKVVSAASCTTNAVVPPLAILLRSQTILGEKVWSEYKAEIAELLDIDPAVMELDSILKVVRVPQIITTHAVTKTQALLDEAASDPKKAGEVIDYTKPRAAMANIAPSTSGAATETVKALPELGGETQQADELPIIDDVGLGRKGLIGRVVARRVPTITGSLADLEVAVEWDKTLLQQVIKIAKEKEAKPDKQLKYAEQLLAKIVNYLFLYAGNNGSSLHRRFEYTNESMVSSDVIGNHHGSVVAGPYTQVVLYRDGTSDVHIAAFYDNEQGYANNMLTIQTLILRAVMDSALTHPFSISSGFNHDTVVQEEVEERGRPTRDSGG